MYPIAIAVIETVNAVFKPIILQHGFHNKSAPFSRPHSPSSKHQTKHPTSCSEAAANDAWAVFDDRPKRASEGNVLDMPPWVTPPIQRSAAALPPTTTTNMESLLDLEPMVAATVEPGSSEQVSEV